MVTAFGSVETAVDAMKMGPTTTSPSRSTSMRWSRWCNRAMERQNLIDEVRTLRSALDQRYGFESIVGRSKSLLRVLDQAARVSQYDSSVLIQGETGTGKELLARAIHHNSPRRKRAFVPINCGCHPARPGGVGVVRLCARRLHRRDRQQARPYRSCRWGHTLFG